MRGVADPTIDHSLPPSRTIIVRRFSSSFGRFRDVSSSRSCGLGPVRAVPEEYSPYCLGCGAVLFV